MGKRSLLVLALLLVFTAGCAATASPVAETPVPTPVAAAAVSSPEPDAALPSAITAPALAAAAPVQGNDTPESTAQRFYEWYLNYVRTVGNPLVNHGYRSSTHMTAGLIKKIDKTLASFTGGGYDPILCAQDIPERFEVGAAEVNGDHAKLVVRTNFVNHWLDLSLVRVNGEWKIEDIACMGASRGPGESEPVEPQKVVQDFFDWYLEYARGSGSPMISGAYKDSGHLTEAAIERIGNTWAGFGDGPRYDPILCAQDIPESFTVEPATIAGDQARVYVRMLWNGSPATSQTATLVLADGEWRIDDLTCAIQGETATAPAPDGTAANGETANWQIFRDADHGYEIKYPQGWKTIQPEVPPVDGSPLLLATGFAPEDGPRDLVPVSVEVYRGSLEEFLTAYPGNGEFEFMEINGAEVLFDPADPVQGDAFYIFQDAGHADLRVVLRHTVMARQVVDDLDGIVERMVATFRFAD